VVQNVNQYTTTYTKVHGGLPTHHILPNGDLVFRFEGTKDSGEYQCQAITDKGTFSASFYGTTLVPHTHDSFILISKLEISRIFINKTLRIETRNLRIIKAQFTTICFSNIFETKRVSCLCLQKY
jgi:hypothetical protein